MSESNPCGVGHPDEARLRAEALWEELGGDLCICQRAEVLHWCETCQRRIQTIEEAFSRLVRQPVPPPGAVPACDVPVWCAHCEHQIPTCPSCGKAEWRLGDVPPSVVAAVPAAPQDDGDPADAILQSVLMLIGLPSYDSAWFNENGDWDIGLLRQHGLDRRITEIRAAEVSAAVPAAQDARDDPQEAFLHPAHQVFFRAGLIACREYMARFVESESPTIAASIRANWWPALGTDYGPPRLLSFSEVTSGEFGTPAFRTKTADEVSPTQEALPVALAFLQQPILPASHPSRQEPPEPTVSLSDFHGEYNTREHILHRRCQRAESDVARLTKREQDALTQLDELARRLDHAIAARERYSLELRQLNAAVADAHPEEPQE